ncbi:MAG: alternative ribosome rescue aminoacyl-tRNA hydrolase ArfB [Halofilum sp. (in: g-proteobacteria)]
MLQLTRDITIAEDEVELTAIGASGPGGQHVNKASTAVHLRFDVASSSLPERYKRRLLAMHDHRITRDGVVVIKAQEYRSREKNEQSALERLGELIEAAGTERKPRRPTRPSKRARGRRTDRKTQRGRTKSLRKPPQD